MPFQSKAQMRACYAADDPNWDCGEWQAHTPDAKNLPDRKKKPKTKSADLDPALQPASGDGFSVNLPHPGGPLPVPGPRLMLTELLRKRLRAPRLGPADAFAAKAAGAMDAFKSFLPRLWAAAKPLAPRLPGAAMSAVGGYDAGKEYGGTAGGVAGGVGGFAAGLAGRGGPASRWGARPFTNALQGRFAGMALDEGAQTFGLESPDSRLFTHLGTAAGAAAGVGRPALAAGGYGQAAGALGRYARTAERFSSGAFNALPHWAGRAGEAATGVANPYVARQAPSLAYGVGRGLGTAGLAAGALGLGNAYVDHRANQMADQQMQHFYEHVLPSVEDHAADRFAGHADQYLQHLGLLDEQGRFDYLQPLARRMPWYSPHAPDPAAFAAGVAPGDMSPAQRAAAGGANLTAG